MDKKEIEDGCSDCGCETNICWSEQNKLREKWLADNPDSEYQGWMSI
jgi:hypothetical protein